MDNNVHDLALDTHLFENRVVGMEYMAAMHDSLLEVDTLVVGVVGIVDNVEDVLLCVGVLFGQVGYLCFEQDSSCSSGFVVPKVFCCNSSFLEDMFATCCCRYALVSVNCVKSDLSAADACANIVTDSLRLFLSTTFPTKPCC